MSVQLFVYLVVIALYYFMLWSDKLNKLNGADWTCLMHQHINFQFDRQHIAELVIDHLTKFPACFSRGEFVVYT